MLDTKLIKQIKNNQCSDSLKELSARHTPLCVQVYQRYSKRLSEVGMSFDDFIGEKDFIIYSAVNTYKSKKKTKFSTWLASYTRYYILTKLEKNKILIMNPLVNMEDSKEKELIEEIPDKLELFPGRDIEYIKFIISQLNNKRTRKIFQMRYFNGSIETWSNIARKLRISSQTAINIHNHALELIKNKINGKSCYDGV